MRDGKTPGLSTRDAALLLRRIMRDPSETTGADALRLLDAMWGLLTLAREGEDIRPLLDDNEPL